MIPAGTLSDDGRPVSVTISIDTHEFERQMRKVTRRVTTLAVMLEALGLSVDQVWATYYTRGAMDPDFESEAGRDNHLRVLLRLKGERRRAAVSGFLTGWATHRPLAAGELDQPLIWHRLVGDTACYVTRDSAAFTPRQERP